jgi:hypothetical protein
VEAAFLVEQAVGGEDVEVRVKYEVIAEGVDGGGGGDASARQAESGAEGVAQAFGRGLEKKVEKVPTFAEDAAEYFCKEFAFASAAPETVRMGTGVGE